MIQPRITALLVLTIFSSFCQLAPAISTRYELGTTYQYQYSTSILLNEPPPLSPGNSTRNKGSDVGYQVAATVDLTAIWQDPSNFHHVLLKAEVRDPKLSIRSRKAHNNDGFVDHTSPLDDAARSAAIYLDWNNGQIVQIYHSNLESLSLTNLKKGLASLFQLQSTSVVIDELDSSGYCRASYKVNSGRTLIKEKSGCQFDQPSTSFARNQKILGFSSASSHRTKYNLKSDFDVIDTLTSTEVHSLRVSLRAQAGASVISRQYLRLTNEARGNQKISASTIAQAIESVSNADGVQYVKDDLRLNEEIVSCETKSCKSLKDAVDSQRKNLLATKVATSNAAVAFIALLPVVRRSSKADILAVLKDSKNHKILSQLLDVVAAAQTSESHAAAKEVIDFSNYDITRAERYLQVVSLSTHPSEYLLQDLLRLSKEITTPKLDETALLSLAAVAKAFAASAQNSSVVGEIQQYFLSNLEACSDELCCQLYLRVLKNLASVETLPVILTHIDSKDRKTSVNAVKALRALPASVFLDNQVLEKLQRVYFQIGRRYDSSARTLALDTLLEHNPETSFLVELLESLALREKKLSEIYTYSLQRLQEFANSNPAIRLKLKDILSNHPAFKSYHVFAQNGLSTAFSRTMYRDGSGNGTFSSSTEALSGMMKRSAFDVSLRNSEDSFELLSFGLFAGGLSSLIGSAGDEPDDEEATAGMEISLAGVQLRQIIFFVGQGELMGHVWSGTASERTSALQATVLLQDHRQVFPLQSGFIAVLNLHGSVSFDFGGEIQISLWNRNSHSVVEDVAAWGLEGSLKLVSSFVKSSVDFTVKAQAKIDFITDVSFSEGILLCLRMNQNKFSIDYTTQKRETIPGTKHWIHKKKTRQEVIPGRTYALNDKNSGLCNEMFAK